MDTAFYWTLFLETGAPEAYLLYRRAAQTAESASA